MNSNTLQFSEKQVIIDFSIKEVHESILSMFKHFPNKYILRENDINDVFYTYHFPISNNINPSIADISLEEISENKTKIKIKVSNAYGSQSSISILEGVAHDYLNVLSKMLKKEDIEIIKQTTNAGTGCMVVALIFIISTISIVFFT